MSISSPESGPMPEKNSGLLPHEVRFLRQVLPAAFEARRKAQAGVGEANANNGGDWAFDDPATQAAAQEAVLMDKGYRDIKDLLDWATANPETPYPTDKETAARPGSRVTYRTSRFEETIDLVTQRIPKMPEDDDNDVEAVSVATPLGAAVLGKALGESFTWSLGDRNFEGVVTGIDQNAQREFYEQAVPLSEGQE